MKTTKTHLMLHSIIHLRKLVTLAVAAFVVTASHAGQGPQPSICTRACWGARNGTCTSGIGALSRAIIHHTAGSGDWTTDYGTAQARVRGVQNYHMDTQGWCDIGYHFLVSAGGHIFEGRKNSFSGLPRGAHDGCNADSFGFNIMGYYHPPYNQSFTAAGRDGLEAVMAWRMPSAWSPYGSGSYCSASVGTLDGHYRVKATACPGDVVIPQIPGIRDGVNARKNPAPPVAQWYDWQPLGGQFTSRFSICSWGANRLDIFGRGTDNNIWHKWWDSTAWGPAGDGVWEPHPFQAASAPAAESRTANVIDLFVIGTDGALWHKWWTGGWSGWENLGKPPGLNLIKDPTVTSWSADHLDVYCVASDNQVWHKWWSPGVWSAWYPVGGICYSGPIAASWGVNRIDLFVLGGGNTTYHKYYTGAGWVPSESGWVIDFPNIWTAYGPGLSSWGDNRLDLFLIGADNALHHNWWNGTSWHPSGESLGGALTSDPAAVSWAPGRVDVVAKGTDNACWHKWYQ